MLFKVFFHSSFAFSSFDQEKCNNWSNNQQWYNDSCYTSTAYARSSTRTWWTITILTCAVPMVWRRRRCCIWRWRWRWSCAPRISISPIHKKCISARYSSLAVACQEVKITHCRLFIFLSWLGIQPVKWLFATFLEASRLWDMVLNMQIKHHWIAQLITHRVSRGRLAKTLI